MKNKFETISLIAIIATIIFIFLDLIFLTLSLTEYPNLFLWVEKIFYLIILSIILFYFSNELSNMIKRIEKIESTLNIANKDEE